MHENLGFFVKSSSLCIYLNLCNKLLSRELS